MKSKILSSAIILVLFTIPMVSKAQFWMTFGSTVGNKLKQDNKEFKNSFCPEVEIGMRFPLSKITGLGLTGNFRWIDTEKINWFNDRKFVWDIYVGPSFFIPFDDLETTSGVFLKPSIGYSTSAAWFDPDVSSGSFSIMLSADIVIHGFMIGGFWRPMKQHIEDSSASSKYGEYMKIMNFDAKPSFGIRIGYFFGWDIF